MLQQKLIQMGIDCQFRCEENLKDDFVFYCYQDPEL